MELNTIAIDKSLFCCTMYIIRRDRMKYINRALLAVCGFVLAAALYELVAKENPASFFLNLGICYIVYMFNQIVQRLAGEAH